MVSKHDILMPCRFEFPILRILTICATNTLICTVAKMKDVFMIVRKWI